MKRTLPALTPPRAEAAASALAKVTRRGHPVPDWVGVAVREAVAANA